MLDLKVHVPAVLDCASVGALLLAMIGMGRITAGELAKLSNELNPVNRTCLPNREPPKLYRDVFLACSKLYSGVEPLFDTWSSLDQA